MPKINRIDLAAFLTFLFLFNLLIVATLDTKAPFCQQQINIKFRRVLF